MGPAVVLCVAEAASVKRRIDKLDVEGAGTTVAVTVLVLTVAVTVALLLVNSRIAVLLITVPGKVSA